MSNQKKKRTVKLLFKGSIEDLDEMSLYEQSFAKLTREQRLIEGWKMVEHVWRLKGGKPDELRFNRAVAVIKRP
jgi:hypothetical protein